jgi:hypothetical protein
LFQVLSILVGSQSGSIDSRIQDAQQVIQINTSYKLDSVNRINFTSLWWLKLTINSVNNTKKEDSKGSKCHLGFNETRTFFMSPRVVGQKSARELKSVLIDIFTIVGLISFVSWLLDFSIIHFQNTNAHAM